MTKSIEVPYAADGAPIAQCKKCLGLYSPDEMSMHDDEEDHKADWLAIGNWGGGGETIK